MPYYIANADGTRECRFGVAVEGDDPKRQTIKVRIDADKSTSILTFAGSQWDALVTMVKNAREKSGNHDVQNRPRLPA